MMSRFGFAAAVLVTAALGYAAPASSQTLSCSATNVRCVDDTSGSNQEYSTIQAAVTAAVAGDTVVVFDGSYRGFEVAKSGTSSAPIKVIGAGSGAIISTPGSTNDGVSLKNVSYVWIEGFDIRGMSAGRCVNGHDSSPTNPMRGLTIRNNKCAGAGREGFYLSEVSNSLIENNSITGSGANGQPRGHGLYLANAGSDNTVLRGNTIYNITGSEGGGMHFNGDLSVGGDGIISGLTIERNTIYGVSFNAFSMDGVQNSTIQNNLVYNVGRSGVRAFQIDGAAGPKNLRVINNTFIISSGWGLKVSEDGGGHVVFNNILLTTGTSAGSICVDNANITSDYNALSNRMSRNNESTILSLSSWQSGGDDANSFQGSSSTLFVNTSAGDYHRKDGSPAVDAGAGALAAISAPLNDRDGKTRPLGGEHDLGAYESASSGGTTPPPPAPAPPTNVRIIR
jgi:parallel beta-helix repeat protein